MRKTEFQEENFSEDLEQTFFFFFSVYFLFFGGKVVLCITFVVISFFLAGKQCYVLAYSAAYTRVRAYCYALAYWVLHE